MKAHEYVSSEHCKSCIGVYGRRYRAANREKCIKKARKYYVENRDKIIERSRKYRAANPEKIRESNRKYRAANPEKNRELQRKYRFKYPEKYREFNLKAYYSTHYGHKLGPQIRRLLQLNKKMSEQLKNKGIK